jgi:hypothetical protein
MELLPLASNLPGVIKNYLPTIAQLQTSRTTFRWTNGDSFRSSNGLSQMNPFDFSPSLN